MNNLDIIKEARAEIAEERRREAIDKAKERILKRERFLSRLLPFTITINWRKNDEE